MLVPEYELKRHVIERQPGIYDFKGADTIAQFAANNNMLMRGHPLVWHASNPSWLEGHLDEKKDERLLTNYIAQTAARYRGRMHSWDVVNEAIAPEQGHPQGLRTNSLWYKAFGAGYTATAFHAAREADPSALLCYCDYSIELDSRQHERKRRAVLGMLEQMTARGVPVDALAIQDHLPVGRQPFDEAIFSRFLADVKSMGLKIMITEFDVPDRYGPADPRERDEAIASLAARFLDVAFSAGDLRELVTWGLSDRYSWLSMDPNWKWPDNQLSRGLPLDETLAKKPLWFAIAKALTSRH